jgi:N6-adenosine-specific RNA methylase IME4
MFADSDAVQVGMGYWTRANSEPCLLATRGKPKRLNADVRMGIIEPRRQHSRKPDCVPARIERLVDGPYLELFARTQRPGGRCGAIKPTSSRPRHEQLEEAWRLKLGTSEVREMIRAVREAVTYGN